MPLRVCAITSSRADWGLLNPLLRLLQADPRFELAIIATGQHLQDASGATAGAIEREGFRIDARVDMDLGEDSAMGVTRSLAKAVEGLGMALARLRPQLVIVLGDRYEILGAAMAATLARVPIAHLCGGDLTEGAMDDAFRHAVTKLSHVHFVTNTDAARRLRQLGEDAEQIHLVGSTGLDRIRAVTPMNRDGFFRAVGLAPRPRTLMVTFHPETLARDTERDCAEMLAALDRLGADVGLLFTGTNVDVQGRAIGQLIARFVASHPHSVLHPSLGSELYISALTHVGMVVGNSSSGLYEAPSFGIPTVNIGDRQKGRLRAASVIDCAPEREAILAAIQRGFTMDCRGVKNPYGDGDAAARIVDALSRLDAPERLLKKRFADWPA